MDEDDRRNLAELLRARLAAAGVHLPADDAARLERDLALHLERIDALIAAADLGPADPPLTDPTHAARLGAVGSGAVDKRGPTAGRSATLPEGAPTAAGEVGARPAAAGGVRGLGEQARMVREGEATSVELVGRALERIERLDGRLGAFVLVLAEEALAEAGERDAARRRGTVIGPLHGVPVAVKDLVDVAGVVTAAGSPKLTANRAERDAPVVERLRGAGAVVIGKTRTHEFAYGVLTPGTVNPWDETRIAGGSSGGSAAAVAAGLVRFAIGSDTAGSIRIPAACCGVVGLKPTYGAVPAAGVFPLSWSCDHVGPIAAGVAEAGLLFEVMSGVSAPAPSPAPRDPLRVGRLVGEDLALVDPAVSDVLDRLCGRLERGGARVDEVELPLRAARSAVATIVLPEMAAAHAHLLAATGEKGYGRRVLAAIRLGQSALASEYLAGLRYRGRFVALVEEVLDEHDALLLPTIPVVAPERASQTVRLGDGSEMGVQVALTALPGAFNCSGSPVVSVPVGLVDGLPVGASLVGRIGGDYELLRVAAAVEAAAHFTARPVLHA
jgi:aspartyl-tRNA(Asn)/glutamyl-tRNA(Gln) amidotransferase subunit A